MTVTVKWRIQQKNTKTKTISHPPTLCGLKENKTNKHPPCLVPSSTSCDAEVIRSDVCAAVLSHRLIVDDLALLMLAVNLVLKHNDV